MLRINCPGFYYLIILATLIQQTLHSACWNDGAFWDCYWNGDDDCWENNSGGSYWCHNYDTSLAQYNIGPNTGSYIYQYNCGYNDVYTCHTWCYGGYNCDCWNVRNYYHCYTNINMAVKRKCTLHCASCNGTSNPQDNCLTCTPSYFRWYTAYKCKPYCPSYSISDAISTYGYTTNHIGQYKISGSNYCQICDSKCNFCNGAAATDCFSCTGNYPLIDERSTCETRFATVGYTNQSMCYERQCWSDTTNCPTNYYFRVAQSTINSAYSSWATATSARVSNSYDNNFVQYRTINNAYVCYFCDSHCLSCFGPAQTQCYTCKRYNYRWFQRANYCQQSCPLGVYTWNSGDWYGEYIDENNTVTTSTGVGDRTCKPCNNVCRWCKYAANYCLQCRNNYFLMDLYAQCMARYITPNNCSVCQNSTYDMCRNAAFNTDKKCVISCPAHFYFPVYRQNAVSADYDVASPRYGNYTNVTAASETRINGSNDASTIGPTPYRLGTNLCMLCDYRCVTCTGPMNTQCSRCRNGFYKWMNNTICDDFCPIGQYIARDQASPINETECRWCDGNCLTCQIYSVNCSSCVGANYAFYSTPPGNVAFLYRVNGTYSQCMNYCPNATNSQVEIGFYGSYRTLTCYPCPTPCSKCDISIIRNRYPDISCGTDDFCSVGLVCTECLLGYVVVGGKCIAENNCREYAYYVQPAVSTAWSSVNCACLDGYTNVNSFAKCNVRCHITCKTCTGPLSTNCATCNTGQSKNSNNECVLDSTKAIYQFKWESGNSLSGINVSSSTYLNCGSSYSTLFGYEDQNYNPSTTTYTSTKHFGYNFNLPSTNYYAIRIKMELLFVDEYNPRGAIYISRDSSTSGSIWSWNYDTKGAYGEQMCGTNLMDYVLFVTAEIPTINRTSESFFITSNQHTIVTNLGSNIYWGLGGVFITALKCHSDCSYCTGPAASDCLVCSTVGYTAVNGSCVCNTASNYYKWSDGICRTGCPTGSGWFRDSATRSCVHPPDVSNCTAPNRFGDSMGTSGYGTCVANCPATYYASAKQMKCTMDCWADSPNQYRYGDSAFGSCESICPAGYIKDILNRNCVLKCPSGYYFQIENASTDPTCVSKCPTGWEYDGMQLCVTDCPSGYFKQQTDPSNPTNNRNKCVAQCVNAFGDPDTGQCTLACPFPKYADSAKKLCLVTCSDPTYFAQVKVSNLNRTCEPACESGQWGNPFTRKCSNYTTDCPDGYYANFATTMCVANCTTAGYVAENSTKACRTSCLTGFAHWESRTCVKMCPSDPPMFAYVATKICALSCNYSLTGLFGDSQANRTCVQTCSASPSPTFGERSTSLCVDKCSLSTEFADPGDTYRRCMPVCSTVPFRYAYSQPNSMKRECVLTCPDSYFGEIDPGTSTGICVKTCLAPNFGDPESNWCRPICKWGYFGWPSGTRPCLLKCPRYWFGVNQTTNRVCVPTCPSGFWGDIQTSMCYNVKTSCSNDTYADAQKFLCVSAQNCTQGTFADPFTKGCEAACSNGYYADDNINTCVPMCSDSYDEYGQWGICRFTCIVDRFADPQANRTCVRNCSRTPLPLFGIIATRRVCVTAPNCPTSFYGNNNTLTCVNPCSGSLPFGDPISRMCVSDCPDGYYGDRATNLCVQRCNFATLHYADNQTGNCETMCTLGTFGVNSSSTDTIPSCQLECPSGSFARDSDRICVSNCGPSLYGDPVTRKCYSDPFDCSFGYFANSVAHECVLPASCQTVSLKHYFAQNSTKTCVQVCDAPNYGDSKDWFCNPVCNQTFFGENTTRLCIADCTSYGSYAETQNNMCVARCSNTPIKHYAEDRYHKCVQAKDCPIYITVTPAAQTFAQNSSQQCVIYCGSNQWADSTTFRCVAVCPNGYYKDDSTGHNLCSSSCPGVYRFRDNSTKSCVSICPASNSTFGDSDGDQCVYTCPDGFFAQVDTNRRCVPVCKDGTWGNKVTRVCITQPLTQCPAFTWADDFTHKCEQVCDAGSAYYGDNTTRKCSTSCPAPSFAWDGTRVCIDICPASLTGSGYFGDNTTTPRKCYLACQTAGYYRDVAASRTCVMQCTFNSSYKTYQDPTTASCEAVCSTYPSVRYADDTLKSCQTACAGSLRINEATQSCVSTCPYLYDPTSDKCVDICPTQSSSGPLFANLTDNNNTCIVATSCPTGTYADFDSRNCVTVCPTGTYISGKQCVYFCPNNYFIDSSTQSCVTAANCPSGQYADNQTRSCVSTCIGTFAEVTLKRCIDVCYGSKYGDPFTHKCETSCSQGLMISTQNNSCVASCIIGLYANPTNGSCSSTCPSPYYADNNTMACVTSCTANPMTFASVSALGVRECVSTCPTSRMHDMINRICVSLTGCPANSYSYTVNMSCVAFCPGPSHYQLGTACVTNCSSDAALKYADDLSRKCVSTCPTGTYKDTVSYKCVATCPTAPVQYYISASENKCTTLCPTGTFADPVQLMCVSTCSLTPRMFAQSFNRVCVQQCPLAQSSFADPTTGACVTSCPTGYFADSRDRTCKQNCSFLFSDSTTSPRSCVENCSVNLYADELTFRCVGTCPPNYYKHTPTKRCVQSCPFGYYLNSLLSLCVVRANCPSTRPYADNLTRLCTSSCSNGQFGYLAVGTTTGGTCVYTCPTNFFSNPRTGRCESSCPSGLFANTDNNTCQSECPYNKFMDSVNKRCVTQCPSSSSLYADLYNRSCVTSCYPAKFTFADDLTRVCQETCSGNQYADEATQKCVGQALCSNGLFSDPHYKKCVQLCYNGTYGYLGKCLPDCPTLTDDVYASEEGYLCVSATDCPDGTYGDPILHKCVQFCPIQSATFADLATKKCVTSCQSPLFADNLTRECVEVCPNVSKLYGDTANRRCVLFCTYPYFADETTNLCVQDCPDGYFADLSSLTCVQKCPEGKYGNNVTNQCQDTCPSSPNAYFGDPDTRMCVLYCPVGTFADRDNNRQCQPKCIGNVDTFAENSTGQCLGACLTGFSNIRTKQCIAVCTAGYYGYNKVCYLNCPSTSPTVYADNSTHLCVQNCPNGTFADLSTLKCVKICPISQGTFGDTVNWICVGQCTGNYYADFSTRMCVLTCPQVPALFGKLPERVCVSQCQFGFYADNSTRTCTASCPFGTYADNQTMKCQFVCSSSPYMFGENITNKCVFNCWADRDMYADNMTQTCVYWCSVGTFADRTTRKCVETCPLGYFAVNRTRRCETGCQAGSFADSLLRICVSVCSVDPIFYGDPIDKVCKSTCPTNSYGDPLSQQCAHNSLGVSTCPSGYFADPNSKLCVQVCPMKFDLYADPNTKICESGCSGGLLADNSTMRCVSTCPTYPAYFANLSNMRCIPFCPANTFADPISRVCVTSCPANSYADSSTWRCVTQCPKRPLTFADDTTWSCVAQCPTDYFSDNSTQRCVTSCPAAENTFAQNTSRQCVRVCPAGSFGDQSSGYCVSRCYGGKYSDNSSRLCVSQCAKYPAYYADPTTDQCVSVCPPNYYAYEDDRVCVPVCPRNDLYRQNSTSSCVAKCNHEEETYADNLTGYCVLRCSVDSWADPTIRVCVAVCPDQPLMYADNTSQSCVAQCPGSTFGENTTRTCVDSCPSGSLSLPQRNLCVRYCPIGFYAYNVTQFCFQTCPGLYYGDPSTRSCVLTCPLNQLLFADSSSKTCVSICPANSYADKKSVSCVSVCPDADPTNFETQTYAADYNNVCVQECSLPTFAYLPTKKCVGTCPNPYYNNLEDHKCKLCPSVCLVCSVYEVCTVCIANHYLENGRCVLTCSSGYYASQTSMKCVSSKLCKPNYGVNSTRTCTSVCPAGSFPNRQYYRCDACQVTCLTCLTWTNCLTCDTTISSMYQNYCYVFCQVNDTNSNGVIEQYYSPDNATCHQSCPAGTFLFVIFCKNCISPCSTCLDTSSNCTSCLNGLYLQGNSCVTQCLSGYKPTTTRQCTYCGTSCGDSLTFKTNITQVDGQNTVFVTFSDDVVINGDPNQIFAIQTTQRRRLLANGYQIVVIDARTIKIIIDNSDSSVDYTVQILQPENIQDVYGNLPDKVRDQISVDLANTYTTSINTAPSNFSTYFAILAVVCVISFLFDIELMKFLQLLYVHYFVVMILPPQLSKVLLALKYSMLNYLPTMYPVPSPVLKQNVPGKVFDAIGDYSFLRNSGFVLTPLAVIILLWIVMKILSVPEINRIKNLRIWCKQQLDEKFKFAVLTQWLNIVFLNTVFFVFMQMRDYNQYDSFSLASIVVAHIMLALFVLSFLYLAYRVISFFREYPKLSENLKKATDLLLQQNQYHKLNSSNIFLFEMKKIDLRNLYYPKVNNENILPFRNIYKFSFLPLCCIFVTYLRSIILSIIIVFAPTTLAQMSLCIPLNVACLLYFSRARPYSFKFNKRRVRNYVAIFHESALIIFELLMIALGILDRDNKSAFQKESFSLVIIYYLCIVCSVSFLYFLFRVGVQIYRRVWMPFTETEIFRVNFPEKYAQIHGAKKQKILKGIDPRAKQALRAMIKNYKKQKSSLRPNEGDKANPQLPIKYKITYFDRDSSSVGSKSSLSKAQRRNMVKQIFGGDYSEILKDSKAQVSDKYQQMSASQNTQAQYEQYEEQIEIKAKDLASYVKNADELLRIKKLKQQENEQN